MQKQYIFKNHTTGEACGFNANSPQQARQRMRKVARNWYQQRSQEWKHIETMRKHKYN